MRICPNCGKEVSEDAAHCGHCGHQLEKVQKKTMMGLGVVDAEALKKKYAESKAKREAEEPEAAPEEDDNSLAKTELMDVVDLPSSEPESLADEASEEFVTAPTEAMDTVDASGLTKDEDGNDLAATEETPQVPRALGEVSDGDEGSVEGGDGRWEIGGDVDEEPATSTGPTDGLGQPEAAPEPAPGEPTDPMAVVGGPEMTGPDVAEGAEAAAADVGMSAAQVGDPTALDPESIEESKSSKKMFAIIGAVLLFGFGCCVVGPLILFFTGVIGGG